MTQATKRTSHIHAAWRALGLIALLCAAPALAQNTAATLRLDLRSPAGAAAGVNVLAVNTNDGFAAKGTSRPDGSVVLTGLKPGEYIVTATPPSGKEVYRTVTVHVGQTLDLHINLAEDIPLDLGHNETIVVRGKVVESSTSEVATVVTHEQMENLPQANRNFLNFAVLAPGVHLSNDETRKEISSGALGASYTNVFVDGVSLKNNVTQGGLAGQDASRGNPFPQLGVQEFRVISQNFKAEYEQAGSAIISAQTRSGGNEYHGDFFATFQNQNLVARDYFAAKRNDPQPDLTRFQVGAAAGGPVIKDKLFFFATYEGNYQNRSNRVAIGNATEENLAQFGQYEGPFASPFREHLGFAKLTWQPSDNQHLDLSATLRTESDIRSFGGQTSYEAAENVKNNVVTVQAKHQYRAGTLTNEATLQFLNSQFNPVALDSNLIGREYVGVIRIGGRDTSQDVGQRSFTLRDDATFANLEWLGEHVVKAGAKVSLQHYQIDKTLYGNPLFRYRQDPGNNLSFDFPAEAQYGVGNPKVSTDNTQLGLYVQDDWQVQKRLTLNLGVRWDIETNPLNNDYMTPADVRAAMEQLGATVGALNGPDFFPVDKYLTNGQQRPAFLGAIQPRLGLAFDVTGNGNTILFAGAGRYYDRTLYNTGVDEKYRLQYQVRTFQFSADGSPRNGQQTIAWRPEYLSKAGLDSLIDRGTAPAPEIFLLKNDLKPLHTDQFNAGVRQQLGPVSTSATFTHIRSENGVGFYPANRQATGNRDFIPTPGGFGNVLIAADDRDSYYTSVQITAEKPYSDELSSAGIHWGASLAYTLAWAFDRGGDFNFDYPTIKDSPLAPAGNDERHRLVISAIVGLPLEIKLSTLITLGSGLPFTIADASKGFGPTEFVLRRNGGRAEGLIQFSQVDLRLAKDFTITQGHRLSAFAEAFNIFDTPNFGGYDGFIAPETGTPNPNFGKPSSVIGPPRSFQFGVGYNF